MAGTFNTTFEIKIMLKLPELNHSAKNLREIPFDRQIIKLRSNSR